MSNLICLAGSDDRIGPPISRYCRSFDFTLLFEDTVLYLLPAAVVILALLPRLAYLWKAPVKVVSNRLVVYKLFALTSLLCLQVLVTVFRHGQEHLRTRASIASGVISIISTLTALFASLLENQRSVHPSHILALYYSCATILDLPLTRSLWLIPNTPLSCRVLAIAIVVCTFAVAALESVEKRRALRPKYQSFTKEQLQGIWGHALFAHTLSSFQSGFTRILREDDIPEVDPTLRGDKSGAALRRAWKVTTGSHRLIKATARAYRLTLLSAVLPRLLLLGASFAQAFLISATIRFIKTPAENKLPGSGPALVGAYVLTYMVFALSTAMYWRQQYRSLVMIRAGLISQVYSHTLGLSEKDVADSSAVTMMGTDIERIVMDLKHLHEAWASLLQVGIAVWLLARQVSIACVVPVAITLISVTATVLISAPSGSAQKAWIERVQARIATTSSMLKDMKAARMLGLDSVLYSTVSKLREVEINTSVRFRKLLIWQVLLSNVPEKLAPFATFTIYAGIALARNDESLLAEKAFSSLALITLLTEPLMVFLFTIPRLFQATACFGRIETYCIRGSGGADISISNDTVDRNHAHRQAEFELIDQPKTRNPHEALVTFKNATIAKDTDGGAILSDINISIKAGITMIVGNVGSGKSTLLETCLRENHISEGEIWRSFEKVAYCSQTPWIQNCSVRDNIVGESSFDIKWYERVLHMCGLENDFSVGAEDLRIAGNNGSALSGGQRQRVALARAIYSRLDPVILDDVLSGVDPKTAGMIAERLLGESGYFQTAKRSVVISTSSYGILSLANDVIVLEDGKVVAQGPYSQVTASLTHLNATTKHTGEMSSEDKITIDQRSEDSAGEELKRPSTEETQEVNHKLELLRQKGSWSVYTYYFQSAGYFLLALLLLFTIMDTVSSNLSVIWLQRWVSANEKEPNQRLSWYIGIYGCLLGLYLFGLTASLWTLAVVIQNRSSLKLHSALLKTVLRAPLIAFQSLGTGETINRFSQDLELVDLSLPSYAVQFLGTSMDCIISLIILCVIAKFLAASVPFFLLVVYLLQSFYLRTSRQVRLLDIEAKAPLYAHFLETTHGLVSIRAFGWRPHAVSRNHHFLDRSQKPMYLLFSIQQWLTLVLDFLVGGVATILVAIVTNVKGFDPSQVGLALNLLLSFNLTLSTTIKMWTMMETSIGAVARIQQFVTHTPQEPGALRLDTHLSTSDWKSEGKIEFENVVAAYDQHAPTPVLQNVDLTLMPRSKTLICGASGSGKSSLLLTLLGLLPLQGGCITIDGVDITGFSAEELCSAVVNVVPQEPFFLHGTLRFNLDPRAVHSDEKTLSAIENVGMTAKMTETGGLDGEFDGSKWSTGQKQLLSMARALLKGGKILVLDEATSSLDNQTAAVVHGVLEKEFKDHTVLVVSHQMRHLDWYDHIVVMKEGRIVEERS